MAISYGTITIVDKTDLGQLSVFLTGSTVSQQTCDVNQDPDVYYPNWETTALVVTPHAYYNDTEINIGTDSKLTVAWSKIENGVSNADPIGDATQPEGATGPRNQSLQRNKNLALDSSGVTYTATFTYKPIVNDNNTTITAVATINFSITSYGIDGQPGAPGKSLQLIGNGSYFTYTWNDSLYGNAKIELRSQIKDIDYIGWECDGNLIYSGAVPSKTGTTKYTGSVLKIAGDSSIAEDATTVRISNLSTNWDSSGYARFRIFEATDASGTEKVGGFSDYFVIYKYKEAAPGDSLYTAYLDNTEETIVTYQGVIDLNGATTRLYVNKGGSNDIINWHITTSDTVGDITRFNYVVWNSLDYPDGIFKGHSTTQITNNGTQNPTINGEVITTTNLIVNSLVSYYSNNRYDVYKWDGTKWILTRANLEKYGPDCAAIITFTANTGKIIFTAQRGTYEGSSFTPDVEIAALHTNFTVTKSASVIGHSLRLSTVNANKASNSNTYEPPTVEIAAIERSNSGVEAYTQQGCLAVVIHPKTGTNTILTQLTPPYNLTLANYGNISYVETFLGDGSTSGDGIEDKQSISISSDGVSGVSPWLFTIDNPYDSISTDYTYTVTNNETYSIHLNATQGDVVKTLYHMTSGEITYPNVTASCNVNTIGLNYRYQGQAMTTSGENAYKVDEITFSVTKENTIIGSNGTITITFYSDASTSVERIYTYKAIPEVLNPITAQIYAEPSTVFTNQTGKSIATPDIRDGIKPLVNTNAITKYTWYAYVVGDGWKEISNSTQPGVGQVYIDGVAVGAGTVSNWINKPNGTNEAKQLLVSGSAVPGYLGFKLEVDLTTGGAARQYTIPINFTDVNDPLQVTLHSTLGEQLVNGQGIGVIYARVSMGTVIIDELPPDDKIGIGNTAPENNNNSGSFEGKLGYCVYLAQNNYLIDYYERDSTSANWTKRDTTQASYQWYFRDINNEPIDASDSTIADNLKILSQNNNQNERTVKNQQFIYLSRDVVNKKLTADVKVSKN